MDNMVMRHAYVGMGLFCGLLAIFTCSAPTAHAAFPAITYRYQHHIFTIDPDTYPSWRTMEEVWTYRGMKIVPPAILRVDGDDVPPPPEGFARSMQPAWDEESMKQTLTEKIGASLERSAGVVTIGRSATGTIVFDGVGMTGRSVDIDMTVALTIAALEQKVTDIMLPVSETQPSIIIEDPELQKQGIREVVTVGESNFAGSPANRRHNIQVGLNKFNGHLIPQGEVFSFNEVLGPVDGKAGYLKELVIKGDKTEPDYGGGLCQISSTAYRGVWEYGFPIVDRKNHSYAVSYYEPVGTDATVYLPNPDMKFLNDSSGALLIQTHTENDKAYYIYYGTRDARQSEVYGPLISNRVGAPPDKFEVTPNLPPGVKRKVGDRHAGMSVTWYRTVTMPNADPVVEPVYSIYQARPLFYQVGAEIAPEIPSAEGIPVTPEPDVSVE